MNSDLIYRLRKRAEIRRQIPGRKSVQENKPDRIADLLEEAADALESKQISVFDIPQGFDITREELIEWLEAKYRRHKEIEDKYAADMLRADANYEQLWKQMCERCDILDKQLATYSEHQASQKTKKHEPTIDLGKYAGTYGGYITTETKLGRSALNRAINKVIGKFILK